MHSSSQSYLFPGLCRSGEGPRSLPRGKSEVSRSGEEAQQDRSLLLCGVGVGAELNLTPSSQKVQPCPAQTVIFIYLS